VSTTAQNLANLANALKSTGPKSPEGKQRTRLNAVKHGFTSQVLVLPENEHKALLEFRELHLEVLSPVDAAQRILADEIVDLRYRVRRMGGFESTIISVETQRIVNGLLETRDGILNETIDTAIAVDRKLPSLDKMRRYENSHNRHLKKLEIEYKELQAARELQVKIDMPQAIRAYKFCERKGLTFDPKKFGFVLTTEEVEAKIELDQLWKDIKLDENPPETREQRKARREKEREKEKEDRIMRYVKSKNLP
jgi:hypothetical protein